MILVSNDKYIRRKRVKIKVEYFSSRTSMQNVVNKFKKLNIIK